MAEEKKPKGFRKAELRNGFKVEIIRSGGSNSRVRYEGHQPGDSTQLVSNEDLFLLDENGKKTISVGAAQRQSQPNKPFDLNTFFNK